jgi:hypothetical protein
MPALPDVLQDPRLLAVLVLAIAVVIQYQRTLSWREYRRLHALKLRFLPVIDRYTNLFVVSHKGYHDDAEYLATVDGTVPEVFRTLVDAGGTPHLVNSIKKRRWPDGAAQYSQAHVVWNHPETGEQTEAYLFGPLRDGEGRPAVDVYAHGETWTLDPEGHFADAQQDGDPRGVVHSALGLERDSGQSEAN